MVKQGKTEEGISEGERSLQSIGSNQTQLLRAVHAFLAKVYFAAGRENEAKVHQKLD
ncbi:MAG: hypothetical protein WKF84_10065 [Pyrinomonadaceae bacterium]